MNVTPQRMLGMLLLLLLLLPTLAMDGSRWLAAYQAYLRKDYATAHTGFTQLLQGELATTERTELLWYDACCLQQLQKPADAAAALETLLRLAPDDPHFDGLAFLYRYYLDTGATAKADALWAAVLKRWGGTAGMWKLVGEKTAYLAQHDPPQVAKCVEQLAPLTIAKNDLIQAFYQPLFRTGHYDTAKAVHAQLQQYFAAHHPGAVEEDKRAYEDAISEDMVEAFFTQFKTALAANDLDAARTWLANLNATIPEHPRAVEARKLYREAVNNAAKERTL